MPSPTPPRGIDPKRWGRTAASVGAAVGACALAGSLLSDPDSAWFRRLPKPAWQPPAAAFSIVWTGLYALIALASTSTIAELDEDGRNADATAFRRALGSVLWATIYTTVGFAFWAAAWAAATRSPWPPLVLALAGLAGVVAWRTLRAAPRPAPAGPPAPPPSQA